ncbi:MAG: polysaccharide pyruvyl transferase family protein [Leptolinea sp.]
MVFSHSEHIPFPLEIRTHQMFTGLGAGNIGDELMMLGFLKLIQPREGSAMEVWNENSPAIPWFTEKYHYPSWLDDSKCEQYVLSSRAVLLVGGTPVSHLVGLDWPLRALKKRLLFCHDNRIPVHAVGIGVDHLNDTDAIKIFHEAFLQIKSWSVRSANCRHALMELGISENRIVIAADLAWLYEPEKDCTSWAMSQWKLLGVDFNRPLIGVNVVSEVWGNNTALYKNIALALDRIAISHHAQIAFICNEVRDGEYFDHAAAVSVMDMMEAPTIFLPNRYYHPDEMIGLLSHVDVSLSQRYHFTIQSVIAGTVPVSFARGQKLAVLIEELGMNSVGDMEKVNPDTICREVTDALERRDYWRSHLLQMKKHLRLRAMNNGCFIKQLSAAPVQPGYISATTGSSGLVSSARLASVDELESVSFQAFMAMINGLAAQWGLRVFTDWSKVWEYPWLWFNALFRINWQGKHLVDLGSEISPMPWFIALLGAKVTLIETDANLISVWEKLKDRLQVDIQWHIVNDEVLPLANISVDVLTSFSVIEHQLDKIRVVNEIDRVLKPGGLLAISYDICEPGSGMSFPEWNGAALTMQEFEAAIWSHPAFGNWRRPDWNIEDIPAFLAWHQQSAPHHRYVVGAAVLQKQSLEACCTVRFVSGWFDEESDASGSWRWSANRGTVELHCITDNTSHIEFELSSVPSDNSVQILFDGREIATVEVDWSGFHKPSAIVVDMQKGAHTLVFCSHKAPVTLPSDSRLLAFSIKNITVDSK